MAAEFHSATAAQQRGESDMVSFISGVAAALFLLPTISAGRDGDIGGTVVYGIATLVCLWFATTKSLPEN
jgi:hypothetical protein